MHLILADTLQFCTQRSIWRPLMTTPTFPSRSPFFFYYYFYFLSFLSPSMLLLLLLFFFVVVVIRLFIGPFRDGGEPMALKRWGSTNYSCKSRDVMPWIPIESANICIDGGDWKVEVGGGLKLYRMLLLARQMERWLSLFPPFCFSNGHLTSLN